ncbi:MAG: diacylglycerol O-acyltransferase [Paracoccaceae bacterium]|jgi:diacylglycerol O-acyltransferase
MMDLAFFLTETEASPKHIGGLMIFSKPKNAPADFVKKTYEELLSTADQVKPPFNQIIHWKGLGLPRWKIADNFQLSDHLFYRHLPAPGNRRVLNRIAGELHTPKMDRERPMWEMHVLDGMEGNRFAVYTRLHHAYADGATITRWTIRSFSESPRVKKITPIWSVPTGRSETSTNKISPMSIVRVLASRTKDQAKMIAGLSKLNAQLVLEQLNLTKNAVAVPFKLKHKTVLTGQVAAGRQVSTATVPMARVNHLRKVTRSTLNHVALTCIDGALHRYLEECGTDLQEPITIQMPVNLRTEGDEEGGNKIGIVLVDLARKTNDPYERLREIGFTLRNVRYQIDGVPASSVIAYTLALGVFAQLAELLNLSNSLPPLGNTLVSNVPGPRKPLYMRGAKLEEQYPISALTPANHMNITLFSYDQHLHFGLVASHALPNLDKLGGYIHDAFIELEEAVNADR